MVSPSSMCCGFKVCIVFWRHFKALRQRMQMYSVIKRREWGVGTIQYIIQFQLICTLDSLLLSWGIIPRIPQSRYYNAIYSSSVAFYPLLKPCTILTQLFYCFSCPLIYACSGQALNICICVFNLYINLYKLHIFKKLVEFLRTSVETCTLL